MRVGRRIHWWSLKQRSRLRLMLRPPIAPNAEAPILIQIRYSLLMRDGAPWVRTRNLSFAEYQRTIFDPARLSRRLRLFREVALPSLAAQTLPMREGVRELALLVSTELPPPHLAELQQTFAGLSWVRIVPVPADSQDFPWIWNDRLHANVTMDDDDAVSRDFLERLSGFVRDDLADHVITFPAGYNAMIEWNGPPGFERAYVPLVAIGLAVIARPGGRFRLVFDLGNHMFADRMAPVIFGDLKPAFIRTVHDSGDRYPRDVFVPDDQIQVADVRRDFDFNPAGLVLN